MKHFRLGGACPAFWGSSLLNSSLAVPRSIAGGVSHIGEVARSDGGVEKRYLISRFLSDIQPPRPTGTPPISFYDEQRERIENGISRFGTKIALYPSPLSHNTTGHGWGEGIKKLSGIYTAR